jgi:glycerate 2-kinase
MIIKNFDQLASTPLRRQAMEIIEAGFEAIQPDLVIRKSVVLNGDALSIQNKTFDLTQYENLYVVAFGKSSYLAAKTLEEVLGDRITQGYAIGVTTGDPLKHIEAVVGTHPRPSELNAQTARKIIELIKNANEKDLVLVAISGGGSALLTAPFKIDVETKANIGDALMNGGANIHELNIVRKHLSEIKGGRLAELAYPAKVVSMIFSDVPGNDLATIASGPTVLDPTTVDQAKTILEKYKVYNKVGLAEIELTESPKDPTHFERVDNLLILDPTSAVTAMVEKSKELGFNPRILSTTLEGDAHEVGAKLLNEVKAGEALIAAGESTVNVKGTGVGGRNLEVVLGNLKNIKPGQVLISGASDGHDHCDLAGAIGDENSVARAQEMGLDPDAYSQNSDSFNYFMKTGDGFDTGALDSNIADMFLAISS